jgi:biopolymer transport protein ExbB
MEWITRARLPGQRPMFNMGMLFEYGDAYERSESTCSGKELDVPELLSIVTEASKNLLWIVIKGGIVMVPLLASSLVALTVVVERLLFWRRMGKEHPGAAILALVAAGNLQQALKLAGESNHPVAQVLSAGIEHQHAAPDVAMAAEAQAQLQQLKRYLAILDTIITLAPLLGLLGTVTGMIGSFGIVSEVGLGQPHAITGGVAEALIATATGLFIAISALLPYNYFRASVEEVSNLIEVHATRLELYLQQQES